MVSKQTLARGGAAVILVLLVIGAGGWLMRYRIAVLAAPKKEAAASRSEAAIKADEFFWTTFHNGDYNKIQSTLEALTAAYLQTPSDPKTAAHIAWLHNWRSAERARMDLVLATITDDSLVARRYFQEAVKLDPSDARYLGFLAGHTLIEGTLHEDERLTREGYFMMLDAIKAWPEFNLFTGGYVFSRTISRGSFSTWATCSSKPEIGKQRRKYTRTPSSRKHTNPGNSNRSWKTASTERKRTSRCSMRRKERGRHG
jgi:hypothetical protein